MQLIRVEFHHYRSIQDALLDVEPDITCLVGVNETGKSNVLLALEKSDRTQTLLNDEISRHSTEFGQASVTPELRLWLKPTKDEKPRLRELLGCNVPEIVVTKVGGSYRLDSPQIIFEKSIFYQEALLAPVAAEAAQAVNVEPANPPATEAAQPVVEADAATNSVDAQTTETDPPVETAVTVDSEPYEAPATEATEAINGQLSHEAENAIRAKIVASLTNEFIPRFLRFDSVNFNEHFLPLNGEVSITELIANPTAFRPVLNLLKLGGIADIQSLQVSNYTQRLVRDTTLGRATQKINAEILNVVWPIQEVEIELEGEGDFLKIRLKERGETSVYRPDERSRGLQWALAFNIYFLAETKEALQKAILLLDEPGIFLHITAQAKLLGQTFKAITDAGNQVIYTTHLPYLIDSAYPERIRILERDGEDTLIGNRAWSEGDFGLIPEPVQTALGLRWTEILRLDNNNVIVEGPSDQIIYRALHKLFGTKSLVYLPAYGDKKIPSVLAIVDIEGKSGCAVPDGDADMAYINEKCQLARIEPSRYEPVPTLVGKADIITIEDVLPEEIFRQAVFGIYERECRKRPDCTLTSEEIPVGYPRVQNAEKLFANKFGARKGHKLLKVDIARTAARLIVKSAEQTDGNEWLIAKTLIAQIESKFPA